VIAFAIPDLANTFFADIGNAVAAAAAERSYQLLLAPTGADRANEARIANGLHPHLVDGVILFPFALRSEDLDHGSTRIPTVILGERLTGTPFDHIVIDSVAGARLATSHLISLGRRRIAALGIRHDIAGEFARLRLQGYSQALAAAGRSIDPELIVPAEQNYRANGARAMQCLLELDDPPDAVFCFSDTLAIGAMRTLYEAGYRIPDDVAVIGWDGIEEGLFATPSLSTIAINKDKMGRMAVSLLTDRIKDGNRIPPRYVDAPFDLVVRESAGGQRSHVTLPPLSDNALRPISDLAAVERRKL